MKKSLFQKVLCLILSVTTLLGIFSVSIFAAVSDDKDYASSNNNTAATKDEMTALVGIPTYAEYLEKHVGLPEKQTTELKVDITNPDMIVTDDGKTTVGQDGKPTAKPVKDHTSCEGYGNSDDANWQNFGDNAENSLYLPSSGKVTWKINIPAGHEGYYYLEFEYFSCKTGESSVSAIERKLLIDGRAPFREASNITFDKSWTFEYTPNVKVSEEPTNMPDGQWISYETRSSYKDNDKNGYFKIVTTVKGGKKTVTEYRIAQDINGNSMLPQALQIPVWSTYYCKDASGYNEGNFKFYFNSSTDYQITLEAQREPMIIKSITLVPAHKDENNQNKGQLESYEDYLAAAKQNGYDTGKGSVVRLEAEFPDMVSDSSVYTTNDNSSSASYPSAPNSQLFNIIGENSYSTVGQWAAYKFTVNEKGLYNIGMRYLQSQLQGMYICRSIKLTGGQYGDTPKNPFREAQDIQFGYSKEWVSSYISDGRADSFLFALDAGVEYTLYLECSLGIQLKNVISEVEDVLNTLNGYYLRVLQLTGSSPDENRDYGFMNIMPDVVIGFLEQAEKLEKIKNSLVELCGTTGSHVATLETVYNLLDTMGTEYGDNVAGNLSNLKSYLGTLGTWINDSKKGTLYLDTITICPASYDEEDLPEAKAGFFKSTWFEISSFIYSFFTDYESMGLTKEPTKESSGGTINVWLATGRDQSNIWRTMIDADGSGFTSRTGYGVALKLVTATTLLPSILSGKGPDVYMGLGAADVINYAVREAVIGINGKDTRYFNDSREGRMASDNEVFNNTYYIYESKSGEYRYDVTDKAAAIADAKYPDRIFASYTYDQLTNPEKHPEGEENYARAAIDTLELGGVAYGIPQTMGFAMMFYRMDVLAELNLAVPETWHELLSILPTLQANNMQIGVNNTLALEYMIYQKGGSMWMYEEPEFNVDCAGAQIALDTDVALESFEFVCRLYSDYSFPVSYDAANRFRTGEMPIVIGDYATTYNTLVVYATELGGMWEFCPLPGCEVIDPETGKAKIDPVTGKKELNYDSLANVTATVLLYGCKNVKAAWAFLQWQTDEMVQADYGNKMVALIGPSAKYEAANKKAIDNLSWTSSEKEAIRDQMDNLSSIVNYPGSYIMARYMQFAFLDAVNSGADPVDALSSYIDEINNELTRKRKEFGLPTTDNEYFEEILYRNDIRWEDFLATKEKK